ncbi:MAG TPA: hypothetical protein VEK57_24925 [Thermoanaerobaculia bacterium]|nr:hypothetical protein [Thermoanaerobaculia bacterium]
MATPTSGNDVVVTIPRSCADQLCVPLSTPGSSVVVIKLDRTCAKQLLVALTLALGGKPNQKVIPNQGKKGKGKGKGKGKTQPKGQATTKGQATGTTKEQPTVTFKAKYLSKKK